jgi:hypothetical protein
MMNSFLVVFVLILGFSLGRPNFFLLFVLYSNEQKQMDIQTVNTMILDTLPILLQIIPINSLLYIDFTPINNLLDSLVKVPELIKYSDIIKVINNNNNNEEKKMCLI